MTRSRRLASALLLGLVASAVVTVTAAAPASAAPPVVVDDAKQMYAGNVVKVRPLRNDSDPDGDELAICRVGESSYKKVELLFVDGDVVYYSAQPSAKPKTYTFTYYACDFETLVPGTISITVDPEPEITAKALPGQPGKIKVKNPAAFKIDFLYGSFKNQNPDGTLRMAESSTVILPVRRTRIDWIAFTPKGEFLRRGHVTGIKLPPGTTPPTNDDVSPRAAGLWASGV